MSAANQSVKSKHRAHSSVSAIQEGDIEREIEILHDKFHALISDFRKQLESERKEVADVHETLLSLPLNLQVIYSDDLDEMFHSLEKCKTHREFFFKLNNCWNFIDFELLERIVRKHGGDKLKSAMIRYIDELREFRQTTTVHQLVQGWEPTYRPFEFDKQKYKEYITRLKRDSQSCTLEELEALRKDTRNSIGYRTLSTAAMILHEIRIGSVTVVWLVAEEDVGILMESISELIKTSRFEPINRYGIEFLSLDDYVLYPKEEVSCCHCGVLTQYASV